ncbi:Glycerate dehydrogenase [Aquimixticola soesokkakensis]|uniref:Glycerate dehydrogenase n=1 Tax=Aquimixticola soesokkakensis TaxID=1519096 RepID=A0A1Y5RMA7_9RHOB|nr:D-glycerate dehydrogenase [Aquimixticola soesokkakensis]SLN20769.1 Glycerate dehydrogenase [Aquimixticola soesokkakensis]
MKLLITRSLPDTVMAAAKARFEVTAQNCPLTPTSARAAFEAFDAVICTIGDDLTAAAFPQTPRCKILANFGVGTNHIDVTAAQRAGVAVTNTPGTVTDATADIALTLMLMTARRASEGEALVRRGGWSGWHPTQLLGLHMTGKTLGVIGMGRIGKAIAKRAHFGFDMKVVFHNRSQVAGFATPATQLATLQEVLSCADIVLIAVPATPDTRHLIGSAEIAQMKPSSLLINIARGDIVEEAALIDALQSQKIAGAGLDVYEHEPQVPAALRALTNCTLLPHLGTAALEVREAMGRMVLDNLDAFATGAPLPNPV